MKRTSMLETGPGRNEFLNDALTGLRKNPKEIPCKYLYDQRGSRLFSRICELEAYYLTRCDIEIMSQSILEISESIGPEALIVEYGSGDAIKTHLLLKHLKRPSGYIPVDISKECLKKASLELNRSFPSLEIFPVCGDFTLPVKLPAVRKRFRRKVIYFPGSTIGNLKPGEAVKLLRSSRDLCGERGGMLIGIDLKKDPEILENAYNDPHGVTARFNLNLLERMNRELAAGFNIQHFRHQASYNRERSRIEMYLMSRQRQEVKLGREILFFEEGEKVLTELSYKYSLQEFAGLAEEADMRISRIWTDSRRYFSNLYLEASHK